MLSKAIKKALSTSAGSGGDFLPQPLAAEFINYIRENTFLRQLFTVTPMTSKTKDYAKVLGKTKVYYQPTEGATSHTTNMTTGTIRLTAKKFMSRLDLSEEVIEDAQEDMTTLVKDNLGGGVAEAEEEAMIVGDPDHTPTTATESLADATTWFNRDHKLIFYGLLTLSADIAGSIDNDTRAANRVNAGGSDMVTSLARRMKYNLGKYGRKMQDLVLILNPWSVSQLLEDPSLKTIDKYGAGATVVTGEIGKIYGKIIVIETPFMTDGYGVMTHSKNPLIGDRRRIKIAQEAIIEDDSQKIVITERLDFTIQYKGALCQIWNLDTPSTES